MMEDLERVIEVHSRVNGKKKETEKHFFSETQFNFMIPEIYKGDMCHSLMEDARKLLKYKIESVFVSLLALSHPKVIRPKTRRPAGENYI